MKLERNRAWNKYTFTPEDEKDEKLLDRIGKLEEENKNLKENVAWYEKEEDRLREENKKLKAEKDKLYIDYDNLSNCNADLIQENKKLKEELRIVRELYKANVD